MLLIRRALGQSPVAERQELMAGTFGAKDWEGGGSKDRGHQEMTNFFVKVAHDGVGLGGR